MYELPSLIIWFPAASNYIPNSDPGYILGASTFLVSRVFISYINSSAALDGSILDPGLKEPIPLSRTNHLYLHCSGVLFSNLPAVSSKGIEFPELVNWV